MKWFGYFFFLYLINPHLSNSQEEPVGTLKSIDLEEITIKDVRNPLDIKRLDPLANFYINSGKKNELIELTQKDISLSEKYARQIFSKVPGVFVYDMDGTGNQLNISTRGLDPHRGWEFNIRKDGIITNSDMYGYPASHYNIPMEAVDKIEIVRGTGSLQYGAQFGGLINYKSKLPVRGKSVSFESINTIGSYNLLSMYNSLSGGLGKLRYSTYFTSKSNGGYRHNGDSKYNAENISLYYDISSALFLKMDWSHSNYIIHLAGPLTDVMFHSDPRQSTRTRNYYNPDIHIPSFKMDWKLFDNTRIQLNTSAVLGYRNSVMFDKPATIADSINHLTLDYNNRQVDIDQFNSFTSQIRILQHYVFLNRRSNVVAGIQYMNNDLHRRQQGKGTTGSDFDLTLVTPGWSRDLHFKTENLAFFIENNVSLLPQLTLNLGFRVEQGQSDLSGKINYYPDENLPNTIHHSFPLFGMNAEYRLNETNNIYAGWSQAYRPVIMKDIIPQSFYEFSDKNLKDAEGYNVEAGFRGKWHSLKWDVTGFILQYNNRLGTLAQIDSTGTLNIFRSNIGNSQTKGIELFLQGDFYLVNKSSLTVFSSTSFMDAHYQDAKIKSGNNNLDIGGNTVESVPRWIMRNGMTYRYSIASITLLSSYTSESFADAFNAIEPNSTGSTGLVPSYHILDLNISLDLTENFRLQLNGNNILDKQYFTKRPQFYPGPGIWPSDGRTFSATVSMRI